MNTGTESFLGVGQPFLIPSTWVWSRVFGALNINDLFMFWIHYFAFLCNSWSSLKMQQQFIMLHELSASFLSHAFLVKFSLLSTTITCCWIHLGIVDLHELKYNIGSKEEKGTKRQKQPLIYSNRWKKIQKGRTIRETPTSRPIKEGPLTKL